MARPPEVGSESESEGAGVQLSDRRSGPVAAVEGLQVTFARQHKSVPAVRGVELEIHPGEILSLVGESGSGKSTVGLSLLGLLRGTPPPVVQGSIRVLDIDILSAEPRTLRDLRKHRLGVVFQDPMTSLNPTMRIGRQLVEATDSYAEAERLLGAVGLPRPRSLLRAYPHELSGGQRQRVMIAIAVASNPALVVLDEPTTALDVTVQAQVLDLLRSLGQAIGCAFLFITHDLGVAAQVADRIAVMYAGRIMELGPAAQVLHRPAHPYTAALLRSRIEMGTDRTRPLTTIPGEPPSPAAPPHACPFAPRCPLRIDACDAEPPPLLPAGDGRLAACIRIDQVLEERAAEKDSVQWTPTGQPDEKPVVRLRDVHKDFQVWTSTFRRARLHAVRGVDLTISSGESVAVVGESGCGKSTMLRMVAGLIRCDRGKVELAPGTNPQMVFQDAGASLTPWLTVGELIGERLQPLRLSPAERADRIAHALAMVGLDRSAVDVRPRQLSGGQRQRAAFARAIVVPPKLLICDEPTSSLDVSLAAVVLNMIGRLRRELQLAVLFVTHDLAAARVVADRIAVMYLGQIVEEGPVDQVTAAPAHPYTKALIAAVPGLARVDTLARGDAGNPLAIPSGCPFHPRCPEAVDACRTTVPELLNLRGRADRSAACILVEH